MSDWPMARQETGLSDFPEDYVDRLAASVGQLGRIVAAMMRRMDEMEQESRKRLSIDHRQALALRKMMGARAADICMQYALNAKMAAPPIRAAIKKAVLARWGIQDLHDLPLSALSAAEDQIARFASIQLVMDARKKQAEAMNQ